MHIICFKAVNSGHRSGHFHFTSFRQHFELDSSYMLFSKTFPFTRIFISVGLVFCFRTCEICHSVAHNVFGSNDIESTEHSNETNNAAAAATVLAQVPVSESRSFWHGHRFLNFLLACMVFAFVLSWLFHFNVPSS